MQDVAADTADTNLLAVLHGMLVMQQQHCRAARVRGRTYGA